jgi:hypothetical protein
MLLIWHPFVGLICIHSLTISRNPNALFRLGGQWANAAGTSNGFLWRLRSFRDYILRRWSYVSAAVEKNKMHNSCLAEVIFA